MSDANYTRISIPARTSSLADLVHKTETNPVVQRHHHHRTTHPHPSIDSDDGSQQERNHQRPNPLSNLPRLPMPNDVSGSARHNIAADVSPEHFQRKRRYSQLEPSSNPPDLSSLTQKPDDHASSIAPPPPALPERPAATLPPGHDERVDRFQRGADEPEGSMNITPKPSARHLGDADDLSARKQRKRIQEKEVPERTELLEENRLLRIELESVRYRLRKAESTNRKHRTELQLKETLLAKYRHQLVEVFEAGGEDLFDVNKTKYVTDSAGNAVGSKRDDINSKVDGESISNSQEEEWSTNSGPSISQAYEEEKSEEQRRRGHRDPFARSEATIRKQRRTRAPAWTAQEEIVFMQAYNKHGCRWKLFQDSLPGRSRRQIQSHGSYLIRQGKLSKKNSRPWQRRKPREGSAAVAPTISVKEAEAEGEDVGEDSERE